MNMPGPAGVDARDNGFEAEIALRVGILVAPEVEALGIVLACAVAMPPVQQGPAYGLAPGIEHAAG